MSEKEAVSTQKKVPKRVMLAWPTLTISTSVAATLFGYATLYATDVMGLSAVTVGIVFMVSKIFDGFTDLVAGFLIDKTNTKMGKGRPWQFGIIGYWVSLVLMFCAPEMGITPSVIYLFVTYTLVNSVFLTMINCSDPVYLGNALDDSQQSVSVLSFTGFIAMLFTMVAAIIVPQLITSLGVNREGFRMLAFILAIPCGLVSMIRIMVVKEKKNGSAAAQSVSFKDMVKLLMSNKYILLFALAILISNIGSNSYATAQTYFYQWIYGDLGIGSIMSLSMLPIIIVIMLMPALSKKFGFVNTIRVTTLIGIVGYLMRLFNLHSLLLLFVSNILSMMGFYTMFAFAATFVIDCIDYGEWKTGVRSEGTLSSAQSVTAKIGTAVGAGIIGVLMGLSGYEGTAQVQVQSANTMIIMLYSVVPAILCAVQFIILKVYDLDKLLPQIRKDLAQKHGATSETQES